jgi:outer membrane immunogenic protein
MKKLLLSTVALATMTAGAMAADLPARRMAPVPYAAVPVFTWTGFYVGANAGVAFANNNRNTNCFGCTYAAPAGTFPGAFATSAGVFTNPVGAVANRNNTGFEYGAQIGYNWQIGTFVIGAEADINGVTGNRNNRNGLGVTGGAANFTQVAGPAVYGVGALNPAVVGSTGFGQGGVDWYGTVRARAGFAIDRALVYATGGWAYAGGSNNNNGFCGVAFCNTNNNRSRNGYALGAGVEYAFTNNLSAKLEYLYVNLNRNNRNGFVGNNVTYSAANNTVYLPAFGGRGNKNDFSVVRAGLNYRFSL